MAKNPTKKMPSFIEFFKVFLSTNSSRQLSFPPAFVVRLNGTVPETAILKDHFGKIWDIKLENTERRSIIKKGWKEFANHHSLVNGDFLVFKYDMNSQFYVKVYGRDGVKKGKALTKIDSTINVKEEPEIETQEGKTKCQSNSGSKRKYSEMASKDLKQTQKTVGRPKGKSKLRWTTCSFGGSRSSLEQARKRGRPTKSKSSAYVKPENPHFAMIMTRTSRYTVYVHKKAIKDHNIKLQENMKLRDENGKLWPVKLCFRSDGRILITDGWAALRKKHKVAMRDMCIFEFIPTENKVIQVHIIRKHTESNA